MMKLITQPISPVKRPLKTFKLLLVRHKHSQHSHLLHRPRHHQLYSNYKHSHNRRNSCFRYHSQHLLRPSGLAHERLLHTDLSGRHRLLPKIPCHKNRAPRFPLWVQHHVQHHSNPLQCQHKSFPDQQAQDSQRDSWQCQRPPLCLLQQHVMCWGIEPWIPQSVVELLCSQAELHWLHPGLVCHRSKLTSHTAHWRPVVPHQLLHQKAGKIGCSYTVPPGIIDPSRRGQTAVFLLARDEVCLQICSFCSC